MMRTAIVGLGNPVAGDDRVGLAVAHELAVLLAKDPLPGVEVLESTRGGLELLELLSGFDRAILIDCVAADDASAGRLYRLTLEQAPATTRLTNPHEVGIADVFRVAQAMGIAMPPDVEIIGIGGAELGVLSEQLSPPVGAAVPNIAREIYRSLASNPSRAR